MSGPLNEIRNLIGEDLIAVENIIKDSNISSIGFIPMVIGHMLGAGGKRVRPILTLAFCKMLGYKGEANIKSAAAIEFIHNATLLHDDVIDDSNLRRQSATVKSIWGNKQSILLGDFLLSVAFRWIVETGDAGVLLSISGASIMIAEGEIRQLINSENLKTGESSYMSAINYKTAVLFSAACEVAAILAQRHTKEAKLFGQNVGMAYQIVDDALDYKGQETGKPTGNDFRTGKMTLPVIISYQEAKEASERAFWERCINPEQQKESDFETALAHITKHKAIEKSLKKAHEHLSLAREQLEKIEGEGEVKAQLFKLLDFIAERDF